MRKSLGICLLILLLTGSAVAGEMPNLSPAPPPAPLQQGPTANCIMPNNATNDVMQTALDLLAVLLSLI
jgi:hypothetical protein